MPQNENGSVATYADLREEWRKCEDRIVQGSALIREANALLAENADLWAEQDFRGDYEGLVLHLSLMMTRQEALQDRMMALMEKEVWS